MIENSNKMNELMQEAINYACSMQHEYLTPEHLLLAMLDDDLFTQVLKACGANPVMMNRELLSFLEGMATKPHMKKMPMPSAQFTDILRQALTNAVSKKSNTIGLEEYTEAMLGLDESYATYVLGRQLEGKEEIFLSALNANCANEEAQEQDEDFLFNGQQADEDWHTLVTDITAIAPSHTPLIGREAELDRTIQVLCRMEKNNPLHVGDPGVGKTAIIYGLAMMIINGKVPERLRDAHIYGVGMGQLLAGTQYRGDFEKRLKLVLDGASQEKAILYLDEIHNIVGAGRGSEGGPDASNILKPYLESGELRFIGATTHEEYNKRIAREAALSRRFQTIDIKEPTVEETINILYGLQPSLQSYHNVTYRKDALEYAARASHKHITGRFLPDKAIDLADEAGAWLEVHPNTSRQRSYVTKSVIDNILTKVCKIQAEALKEEDNASLATLTGRMLQKIYGQDDAVNQVVQTVMMAKAGLAEDDKPLGALLFVGPTGVGKTEVARTLAAELGVELVRFDMSEYAEKHAVAKLIGSPAGYVGYDEGGLLTDAVRKNPNCVLLLDEIEKAHSDIYNILLQVTDYARLTDNHGQKADFRNVILIMTSNAGAQYASQAAIGFTGGTTRGDAMLKQVKKTFSPEFINRLNGIVVFNDIDKKMASLILRKKIDKLFMKLAQRKVNASITDEAFNRLLALGFTKEYGAREIDRVVARCLKPLFMNEILFGRLTKGGEAAVNVKDGNFMLAFPAKGNNTQTTASGKTRQQVR